MSLSMWNLRSQAICVVWLLGLFSLLGSIGCVSPGRRACLHDANCAESAPFKYCFEGFCSKEQCKPGTEQDCYNGALSALGKGTCRVGQQTCSPKGLWQSCRGQILSRPEICDKVDNDCDGQIDEGIDCSCKPGEKQVCYNGPVGSQGKGICQAGLQHCAQDNLWGRCLAQKTPQIEICDNVDNDCDGKVDNGLNCECKPGDKRSCFGSQEGCTPNKDGTFSCQGICQSGQQVCGSNSLWGVCDKAVLPAVEICDGKDNDCDGKTDEACGCPKPGLEEVCYTGNSNDIGIPNTSCRSGKRVCLSSGEWSSCFGEVKPKEEVCNGQDDDCNGEIDERYPERGRKCLVTGKKGPCSAGLSFCRQGKIVCASRVTPSASEICDNGKDDNCNGKVDESPPCGCRPGASQTCFSGGSGCVQGANNAWTCRGLCRAGTQFCQSDSTWSKCSGEILAVKEICDGKDNNCDGQVDEAWPNVGKVCNVGRGVCAKTGKWRCLTDGSGVACSVSPGLASPEICDGKDNDCDGQIDESLQQGCFSGDRGLLGKGECRSGVQVCEKGTWSACRGQVPPRAETCDGKDNNCDGQVDERLFKPCYTGSARTQNQGECKGGFQRCRSGKWSVCERQLLPQTEVCDGKDNDCDGSVDETLQRACYSGTKGTVNKGLCRGGTQVCVGGKWSVCRGEIVPTTEVCDGKDNDCNGQTDEALRKSCYEGATGTQGVGVCRPGFLECRAGQWTGCLQQSKPTTEVCDGKDNDCNGKTDEGCVCSPGQKQACGSSVGLCQKGVQTCDAKGQWGACVGEVKPTTEVCDGKDNNCDGKIDESWLSIGLSCSVGVSACVRKGKYVCKADKTGIECSAKPGIPIAEVCDAIDNDCDGRVDEDLQRKCYDGATNTKNVGACKEGIQLCASGKWSPCLNQVKPTVETCDGVDNDCDGSVDEGLTKRCYSGPIGTAGRGLCKRGRKTCSAGKWGSCVGEITPTSEVCDNLDNDCNNQVDDGLQRTCYTGASGTQRRGLCQSGVETCTAGKWGSCVGEITPVPEICDGKDNNCNGLLDDGNPNSGASCSTGQSGPCAKGITLCQGGTLVCQATTPTSEICDGKDNNCDGKVDDNLVRSCTNSCGTGTQSCVNGGWAKNCIIPSVSETCDGKDNDCDGLVDEGCGCGQCQTKKDCLMGTKQGICVQGYCYMKARANVCDAPFVVDKRDGPTKQYCVPPLEQGQSLWSCQQYLQYGRFCFSTSSCGGGNSSTQTGAVCRSFSCRIYCRRDRDCPVGNFECKNNICLPR